MGIYSNRNQSIIDEDMNCTEEELIESTIKCFIDDDMRKMTLEQLQMFMNCDEVKALDEAGLVSNIGKKTIVKLDKSDDMERRIGMAALNIAREKNDGLYVQLMKNRQKERELLKKINKKYEGQANRVAKQAQKTYLKTHKLALGFMRK